MTYQILHGSNLDILPTLPDNSVDSIVTDPPYGLSDNKFVAETITRWINGERDFIPDGKGFMGKSWDAFVPPPALWDECLRVLKPGGHLLAFFGSRTQDIGALSIRLAGFEIRDSIAWMYGSGFPKSLDISKAIDKAAGAERELRVNKKWAEKYPNGPGGNLTQNGQIGQLKRIVGNPLMTSDPSTPEAQQWEGWGTALKPAFEPIVVARKPLIGTVAENVLAYGTGGLNIDASRIGTSGGGTYCDKRDDQGNCLGHHNAGRSTNGATVHAPQTDTVQGRWPANVILDPYTAELLDEQSGISGSGKTRIAQRPRNKGWVNSSTGDGVDAIDNYGDSGGASRFFYIAKASRRDRNEGVNLCNCDKLVAWENEGHRAKHQADTDQLAERVTGESGTQNNADFEWSMSLSGSESEVESQKAGKSITLMETSSTTTSVTSLPLTLSHTNASTQDANSEAAHGGSLVSSAENSSQLEAQIGISAEKAGHSTADADLATLKKWLKIKSESALWCSYCFGLKGGHPTVKPTDLMRYLIKLVTPPGGVVLDPFTGSGSTGKAAILEGFDFIGIELTDEYLPIIEGRLAHAEKQAEEERQKKDEALF